VASRSLALAVLALVGAGCGAADSAVDSGASAGERRLERYGIRITAPDGWNARLTRGTVEASTAPLDSPSQPVPLADDDVAVTLFEFEPDPASYPAADLDRAYSDGPPRPFVAQEFGPSEEPSGGVRGRGFAHRNFRLAGRRFDLFVEAGTRTPPAAAVAELNALVASLDVTRGDFYPGSVEPPRFAPADGWHVGFAGGGPTRAADYAEAWAATVPYANAPRDLPPVRTLEALPADGILVWVGLARDNRYAPTSELRRHEPRVAVPLRLGEMHGGVGWEGQVRDISLYRLHGLVPGRYHVDAWVFFGDGEPTPEQRARAQAMLDRLDLPDWGRWELDGAASVVSEA
jgi:hypothetical protein